jgi:hypothetical protein
MLGLGFVFFCARGDARRGRRGVGVVAKIEGKDAVDRKGKKAGADAE